MARNKEFDNILCIKCNHEGENHWETGFLASCGLCDCSMYKPDNRIETLNKLVREVEKLFRPEKTIPYLGWFWRDIDLRIFSLSLTEDALWIDEAGKWDYPILKISGRESQYLTDLLINVLREQKLLYGYLNTLKKRMS